MLRSTIRASRAQALAAPTVGPRAALLPAALAVALFGAFLVFGVGFAHSNVAHNAAHDTRHAIGFPCH